MCFQRVYRGGIIFLSWPILQYRTSSNLINNGCRKGGVVYVNSVYLTFEIVTPPVFKNKKK